MLNAILLYQVEFRSIKITDQCTTFYILLTLIVKGENLKLRFMESYRFLCLHKKVHL